MTDQPTLKNKEKCLKVYCNRLILSIVPVGQHNVRHVYKLKKQHDLSEKTKTSGKMCQGKNAILKCTYGKKPLKWFSAS